MNHALAKEIPLRSTSACGKAIIVGEHGVVYGSAAIAMPLAEMQVTLTLKPASSELTQHQVSVNANAKEVSPVIYKIIDEAFSLLGLMPTFVDLDITTKIPLGAGLGSSASLCVGLLRLFSGAYQKNLPTSMLCRYANQLETYFHGTPSGLDTAIVSFEKVMLFRKGEEPKPLAINHLVPWRFLLIDSAVRSPTSSMIQTAKPFFRGDAGLKRVEAFDRLTEIVIEGLLKGDPHTVGEAMDVAARYLGEINVVPKFLDAMLVDIRRMGVYGVKPTGAGGGGCLLALLHEERYKEQVKCMRELFGYEHVYAVEL